MHRWRRSIWERYDREKFVQTYISYSSNGLEIVQANLLLFYLQRYRTNLQGKGSPNYKFHGKIPNSLCLHLIKYMDTNHMKGKKLACREILNWLQKMHAVYCSKHTLLKAMLDIGLSYNPSKQNMRNNNVARIDQIRDYLISLHAMSKLDK